jgi:hypothetical protein
MMLVPGRCDQAKSAAENWALAIEAGGGAEGGGGPRLGAQAATAKATSALGAAIRIMRGNWTMRPPYMRSVAVAKGRLDPRCAPKAY